MKRTIILVPTTFTILLGRTHFIRNSGKFGQLTDFKFNRLIILSKVPSILLKNEYLNVSLKITDIFFMRMAIIDEYLVQSFISFKS